VDGLELDMREPGPEEHRQAVVLSMEEAFERRHAVGHRRVRWRHENGVSRAAATDPVLREAEFARVFATASPAREQHPVDLADETVRQREAAQKA
jgi:hypothetical protein